MLRKGHGPSPRNAPRCGKATREHGGEGSSVTRKLHQKSGTKVSIALVETATVIIGTPTILAGPHPNVVPAVFLANALRPKLRFVAIIGSYGWGGRTVEQLAAMLPNLKVEILPPVLSQGFPKAADFKALDILAATIAEKHQENGFAE